MAEKVNAHGEELDKLYSPSQWSKRLPADVIVDAHIKVFAEGINVLVYAPPTISSTPF